MAQRVSNQFLPRLLLLRQQETADTKVCSKCECVLPLSSFHKAAREYKGVATSCKGCRKSYMEARKGRERDLRLKRSYGLTADEYARLASAQNNACAICDAAFSGHPSSDALVVDHDHTTGKVRGLLCSACNTAIGSFRDDISLLLGAIGYLSNPPARGA